VGELEEVAQTGCRDGKHRGPVIAHAVGGLARQRQSSLDARRVLVREVAADRSEIAGFTEEANVEPVTGERLHEWRTRAMLYRGKSQPFTPPTVSPPTMYFCSERYTTETGSATMIAIAENLDHGVFPAYCPVMFQSAIASVKFSGFVRNCQLMTNSVHPVRKPRYAVTASAGVARGSMILSIVCVADASSCLASASSSACLS